MNKLRSKSGVRKGMKRYARRKARAIGTSLSGRYLLSNDVTRAQIELYDQLVIANGSNVLVFANTTASYQTFSNYLTNSVSFQDLFPIYARYKITGLSVRCSTSQSLDLISTNIGSGPPSCSLAFYPNITGTGLGSKSCI